MFDIIGVIVFVALKGFSLLNKQHTNPVIDVHVASTLEQIVGEIASRWLKI